jgi:hypothetical protein
MFVVGYFQYSTAICVQSLHQSFIRDFEPGSLSLPSFHAVKSSQEIFNLVWLSIIPTLGSMKFSFKFHNKAIQIPKITPSATTRSSEVAFLHQYTYTRPDRWDDHL